MRHQNAGDPRCTTVHTEANVDKHSHNVTLCAKHCFNNAFTKLLDCHTHTHSYVTFITGSQAPNLTSKINETNTFESNLRKLVPATNILNEDLHTITSCPNYPPAPFRTPTLPHLPHAFRSLHPTTPRTPSFEIACICFSQDDSQNWSWAQIACNGF